MTERIKTRFSVAVLAALALLFMLAGLQKIGWAQACTLRTQGYTGGCSNVNVLWFTQTPQNAIARFDLNTFAGRFTASNTARNYSIPTSCSSGGQVVITEVRTNGSTCTAQYSGNLPHNRPCDQCAGVGGSVVTVNGASFQSSLAADAIGTAFSDVDMTTQTLVGFDTDPLAFGVQLPYDLGGVRMLVSGTPVGLFFVSPRQINFHLPKTFAEGLHPVSVSTQEGRTITGTVLLNRNAPGVFTREQNGSGQAMALWYLFRNGIPFRIYPAGSLPASEIRAGDRLFFVVFATGINSGRATMRVNNRVYESLYAGDVPVFIALDQVNFEIPLDQLWNGDAGAQLTVYDDAGNFWLSNGFIARGVEPTR